MNHDEVSGRLKKFRQQRDESLNGLEKCSFIVTPADLEAMGYHNILSEYCDTGGEEHQFHIYEKGSERVVYLESYVDREGGMYHQSLYANPEGQQALNT